MKKTLMTGARAAAFSVGMVLPAAAAELSNGASQSCDGLALWHFINNQTGGAAAGTLSATFTVDGNTTTYAGIGPSQLNKNTQGFFVTTDGAAVLVDASTNLPGRLVLSDVDCDGGGKEDPKK